MALVAAEDIGRTAYGIFKEGPRFLGRTVSLAGEHTTGDRLAAAFSHECGETVVPNRLALEPALQFGCQVVGVPR